MSVDEIENFSEKMAKHVECGVEVDSRFVVSTEKELNARAKTWGRILGVGAAWGQDDRVKQALTSTSSYPPPIYGLPKDHKSVKEGEEHPFRPVCGANSDLEHEFQTYWQWS